jgi:hypothetical protein
MHNFRRLPKMQKMLLALIALIALGVTGYFLYAQQPVGPDTEGVACTMEAKLCPDGVTYVGRQGPKCEFAACPTPTTPSTKQTETVTLKVGERKQVLGIYITPLSILEDSRCPIDVQCIQAGTVRVKMLAESGMGNGDLTLRLNELGTTETEEITLTDVSPAPRSTVEIAKGEYRLTFVVTKR